MKYERFKEIWDATIGNKINKIGMSNATAIALIEYGQGNKDKINSVRKFLNTKHEENI